MVRCPDFEKWLIYNKAGTGTPVGDPIEIQAIGEVFRDSRHAGDPLFVYEGLHQALIDM
jgi:3-oxoacyl-(acyl-carrier-protein) synthase